MPIFHFDKPRELNSISLKVLSSYLPTTGNSQGHDLFMGKLLYKNILKFQSHRLSELLEALEIIQTYSYQWEWGHTEKLNRVPWLLL